ncbi:MAG: hypothetical protein IT210_13900 [Armatimonadetes bacterium]|nr:hypothetical protein [Armatimonadota bacterium]
MPTTTVSWLRPEIAALREIALKKRSGYEIPALPLIDARSWQAREPGEDWLVWRARRTAGRLEAMPIEILPGERVVGRPELRPPTAGESAEIEKVRPVLQEIPPFPGGDAGHFHPDYAKLFRVGWGGILEEIRERKEQADTLEQAAFYRACAMAAEGAVRYTLRVAAACEAADSPNLAALCRRIADSPPRTFHEAIQSMFLALVCLWFGEDHGLTTPGRMDQTLRPFYEADLEAGRITREEALELIACLYIQLNMILFSSSAISVMVGGRNRQGRDATNDLTYLCLEARLATQLVYPTVGLAWHEGTPPELADFACRCLSTGIGDPAFFNDKLIVRGLREHGVSEEDSYDYMNSTCVEIKVVGASHMWVTAPYFNCPKALLDVMEEIAGGRADSPASFDDLNTRVKARIAGSVREAAESLDRVWKIRAETGCFPLASCLIADCLEKGQDFDRGGARYNWVENSFVGLANLVDGLMAIRELVYETGEYSLSRLHAIVKSDFEGHELLRQRILRRVPSYGNDSDDVDALAVEWAEFLSATTESNRVGPHPYVPGFFCWIMHERFGSETGATPDGRRAGFPLSDGAGAAQGREKSGPTASILSTTKWSHRKAIGGLVHNVRFSSGVLKTDRDIAALRSLIETYLRRGGFEIQVNVVSSDLLRDAQSHPENYDDLLVRVAGYSDYFTRLNPNMQAEIIARSEHMGF